MDEIDEHLAYKQHHVNFVSNNDGSGIVTIILVSTVCPVSLLLREAVISWIYRGTPLSSRWCFLWDMICVVLPGILSTTLFSHQLDNMLLIMLLIIVLLISTAQKVSRYHSEKDVVKQVADIFNLPMLQRRPFITNFRAIVNIATAIMILAVDFKVFPRMFCKTETYGTGLMDIGVGGFIVSNAIVSAEARGKFKAERGVFSKITQLMHSITSTIPLWLLGALRILAIKSTDYHEHISEYGVHWNFFFTLAVVRVLSTVALLILPVTYSWVLSLIIILLYQYMLVTHRLSDYIILGPDGHGARDGLIHANREGLFSCLGYLALYLASISLGKFLAKQRKKFQDWLKVFIILLMLDSMLWNILAQLDVEPISRRLANLPYVIWMMAHQLYLLCCVLLVDLLTTVLYNIGLLNPDGAGSSGNYLLSAVNKNGLAYFLLANLFTGAVNICIQTIFVTPVVAYIVLISYMTILSLCVVLLHAKNITLKFW